MGFTTKWKHIERGLCEKERYIIKEIERAKGGQRRYTIECPFCYEIMTIPIWTLGFKGKRCSCGALITADVHAYRIATAQDKNIRTISTTNNPIPTISTAHHE